MLQISIICDNKIDILKFKILDQIDYKFSLRILELLYIHKLNDLRTMSAMCMSLLIKLSMANLFLWGYLKPKVYPADPESTEKMNSV